MKGASIKRLQKESYLIKNSLRVDPFPFKKGMSVVSGRKDRNAGYLLNKGHDLIKEEFRPGLPLLLSKDHGISSPSSKPSFLKRILYVKPKKCFRLLNSIFKVREMSSQDFYVIGVLRCTGKRAARLLSKSNDLSRRHWLGVNDIYREITKVDVAWVKKYLGITNNRLFRSKENLYPVLPVGRFEKAAEIVFQSLLRPHANAVVLKGPSGVGKSSFIVHLSKQFETMCVPGRLQGHLLVNINIDPFMPSYSPSEEASNAKLREMMAGRACIWVLDEAARIIDAINNQAMDNLLLFIDQGGKIILSSDQANLLEKREALVRRLCPVYLPPAGREEVLEISSALAKHQAEKAALILKDGAVKAAVNLSCGLRFAQPHAAAELVANTMAACEIHGREVTAQEVEKTFRSMLAQGDQSHMLPETKSEFIERIRAEGFFGHEAFLTDFAFYFLRAARTRFRPDLRNGSCAWVCLLCGMQGVGKTALLHIIARLMVGSDRKILTIDCSSYGNEHSIQSLLGAPRSYIGCEEGGIIGNFIGDCPYGVIIFKNPELGHVNVIEIIHQLVQGTFTAGDGTVITSKGITLLVSANLDMPLKSNGIRLFSDQSGTSPVVLETLLRDRLNYGVLSQLGGQNVFYLHPLELSDLHEIIRKELRKYTTQCGLYVDMDYGVLKRIMELQNSQRLNANTLLNFYRRNIEPRIEKRLNSPFNIKNMRISLDSAGQVVFQINQ